MLVISFGVREKRVHFYTEGCFKSQVGGGKGMKISSTPLVTPPYHSHPPSEQGREELKDSWTVPSKYTD